MTDRTLNLEAAGPTPDPLDAKAGDKITITNDMDGTVTVTASSGLFSPNPDGGIEIDAHASVTKTAGNTSGTYEYTPPGTKRGTRSGRIVIS